MHATKQLYAVLILWLIIMVLVYWPLFVAAGTMGESAILTEADSGNANVLIAQKATLTSPGKLKTLSFYVTTTAGSLRFGVYDASGPSGGPGKKLAETVAFTPVANQWNTAAVLTPVDLQAGTYWLAYLPSSDLLGFRKKSDATSVGRYYTYTFGAMPAVFSTTPSSTPSHWSFYATLDAIVQNYQQGVDLVKPVGCANPTTRTDGASLALSEIARVELYFTQQADLSGIPAVTVTMPGGCQDMSFDLTKLTPGMWYEYGKTFLTAAAGGLNSAPSTALVFQYIAAPQQPPNPPINVR